MGAILFALGFVVGMFFLPVKHLVWDFLDDTVVDWWYNRPRR